MKAALERWYKLILKGILLLVANYNSIFESQVNSFSIKMESSSAESMTHGFGKTGASCQS